FGPDPRSTEPVIEFRQPIRFRHANLVDGGATEELGPPEFGLGPAFDQHTRAMWARDKKPFHRRPPIGGGGESTGRLEESRGLGGRPFAPSGCEIRWEAPRVSRFQDAPLEQNDG